VRRVGSLGNPIQDLLTLHAEGRAVLLRRATEEGDANAASQQRSVNHPRHVTFVSRRFSDVDPRSQPRRTERLPVVNSNWLSRPLAGRPTIPKTGNGAVRPLVALPGRCTGQRSRAGNPPMFTMSRRSVSVSRPSSTRQLPLYGRLSSLGPTGEVGRIPGSGPRGRFEKFTPRPIRRSPVCRQHCVVAWFG
jgi:hypothetical protein